MTWRRHSLVSHAPDEIVITLTSQAYLWACVYGYLYIYICIYIYIYIYIYMHIWPTWNPDLEHMYEPLVVINID
jgi:hypothetical protein